MDFSTLIVNVAVSMVNLGWCKTWTGLWTGLWTEIWTGFWTDAFDFDDHFQLTLLGSTERRAVNLAITSIGA